jgi:hypothetical protein
MAKCQVAMGQLAKYLLTNFFVTLFGKMLITWLQVRHDDENDDRRSPEENSGGFWILRKVGRSSGISAKRNSGCKNLINLVLLQRTTHKA